MGIHNRLWAPLAVAAGVLCSLQLARAQSVPAAGAALRDLGGVAALRSTFEQDRDQARIVLLLSPT